MRSLAPPVIVLLGSLACASAPDASNTHGAPVATCGDSTVVVCNYEPAGSVFGEPVY